MWVQRVVICGHSLAVVINKEVARKTGLKKGDYVVMKIENGKIVIEPLKT